MNRRWIALSTLSLTLVLAAALAAAHESRPAYLELRQLDAQTYDVSWKVPGQGERMRLALDGAFAAGTTQLGSMRTTYANNAFLQQWRVRRPGGFDGSRIRIVGL